MKSIFEMRKPLEIEVLFEALSLKLSNGKNSFMNVLTSHTLILRNQQLAFKH